MTPLKILFIAFLGLLAASTNAAGPEPTKTEPVWIAETMASIKSRQFEQAINQLQIANQTTSADWNNLMGFSHRSKQSPDLVSAQRYYETALKIEPSHKGALEYYGMLKLVNNDLPGAEAMLARLDKACFFSCEEFRDLKKAIQDHKNKK